jgi:hypothetical protein
MSTSNNQSNGITIVNTRGTRIALAAYVDPTSSDRKQALNNVRTGQIAQQSEPEGPRQSTFGNVSVSSNFNPNNGPTPLDVLLITRIGQTFNSFRSFLFGRGSQAANTILSVQNLADVPFVSVEDIDEALGLLREKLVGHITGKYSYSEGPSHERAYDPNAKYSSFDQDLVGEVAPVGTKSSSSNTRRRRV